MTSLWSLDASLPEGSSSVDTFIDKASLPLPCEDIPISVSSLVECAEHAVNVLMKKTNLSQEEEDALDDGFVLCDLSVVRKKLQVWYRLFPRVKPFFALKCNPDIMVAAVLGQQHDQAGFDCASVPEIDLALQSCNGNARRCIYANPQRAEGDLDKSLDLGVEALTFDGSEELQKAYRSHQKRCANASSTPLPPEMVLRILVPDATSSVPLGEKFGAPPSRIEPLVREAVDLGLPIVGVSFHCGSGCHDPQAYENAIRLAKGAMEIVDRIQKHPQCTLLDIGGGFPGFDGGGGDEGRFCGKKEVNTMSDNGRNGTTSDIAAVVSPLLEGLFPAQETSVQIISEPGRYFVEEAFVLCSRIYSVRVDTDSLEQTPRRHYYVAQGVHGVFKDVLLCNESFVPTPLLMDADGKGVREEASGMYASTVHGPSGEDYDIVCRDCELPPLQVGDWLIFDRMGAYTLSIASSNGSLPIRYVLGFSH